MKPIYTFVKDGDKAQIYGPDGEPIQWEKVLAMLNAPRAEVAPLNEVWLVANKTSSLLFESAEMARAYVSQCGASVGGGMSITPMPVFRAPSMNNGEGKK